MKKSKIIILIVILAIIIMALIFCGEFGKTKRLGSDVIGNAVSEWISPEGVHYWVYLDGLAPRYDVNGKLVID